VIGLQYELFFAPLVAQRRVCATSYSRADALTLSVFISVNINQPTHDQIKVTN
jgi:hypothetical protein